MKKIAYFIAALVVGVAIGVSSTAPASANLFNGFKNAGLKTVPTTLYLVEDPSGYDIRVYEWKSMAGKDCAMGFSSTGSVGFDCE